MRMRLVPVSCGSYIILTFKKTSVADTNLLQSYLKVLLKKDRIKKVPAVEAALWHLIIIVVIIMKEGIVARVVRIAKIRSTVLIFNGLAILLCCKAPGTAEVIFCSSSANGWIILVSIDVEFHLTFSVPVAFEAGKRKISSNVLAFPFDVVEDNVVFCLFRYALTTPLGMEIGSILRNRCQAIVDLIKEGRNRLITLIFNGNTCVFTERHREIAVETTGRIDSNRD